MNTLRKSLIIVFTLAIVACGGGGDSSSGGNDREVTKIVAFGDSIGTGHNIATGWPRRLGSALSVNVRNESAESRLTSNIVGAVPAILDAEAPSHMVVLLGTNDARRGSVSEAIGNLQFMVDQANQRGIVAIVGTLPINQRSSNNNQRAAEISNAIQSLNGARVAQVRNAIGDGRGLIADGIHPNDRGQEVITAEFLSQF